ncbi:DUF5131 family protein [Mycobacterium hubeiense]|uniref:DUF5131 family protein n=1 Tax=Mycobacterium hubeiense TaxID=1867256 RepID=UPI000C7F6F1A|nr:phage Gp37/Gp68 family protein [Mycobacterium sp. QGD 101]
MSDNTNIEWTEATWSPVTGCTKVSAGCLNCYIERTRPFRMAHRRFDGDGIGGTTGVQLHPVRLRIPLRWRKPKRIFVCSMADLFHDEVPDDYIADVFAVMAANYCWDRPTHTFQVVTKRHARMRSLLSSEDFRKAVARTSAGMTDDAHADNVHDAVYFHYWPLPNVHLIVTAEDQKQAELRIPVLLDTPAAVRGVSLEPLLSPIKLTHMDVEGRAPGMYQINALTGRNTDMGRPCPDVAHLDWVIVGGESGGRGARPMHPDWARSLRDQCQAAGVPFLFKQWGEWTPERYLDPRPAKYSRTYMRADGTAAAFGGDGYGPDDALARVGKKRAGRELDGRTWDQYPETVTV